MSIAAINMAQTNLSLLTRPTRFNNVSFSNNTSGDSGNNINWAIGDSYSPSRTNFMAPQNQEAIARRLEQIRQRLRTGEELSGDDMAFLREHAPETYSKVSRLQRERAAHRAALEAAQTRDEVKAIQARQMAQVQAELQRVVESGDDPTFVEWKSAAMMNEFARFLQSEGYEEKPYEHELVTQMLNEQEERWQDVAQNLPDNEVESENDTETENEQESEVQNSDENANENNPKSETGQSSTGNADLGENANRDTSTNTSQANDSAQEFEFVGGGSTKTSVSENTSQSAGQGGGGSSSPRRSVGSGGYSVNIGA